MKEQATEELSFIIKDPKKKKIARAGLKVLQTIKQLRDEGKEPTPGNITERYYQDESSRLSEQDIHQFVNRRRSVISRKLSTLQDIGLVMAMEGTGRKDGRATPYFPTTIGIKLLKDEKALLSLLVQKETAGTGSVGDEDTHEMTYKKKFHSNRIRMLLQKIKAEVSNLFENNFVPDSNKSSFLRFNVSHPDFKKDPLYEDLDNHMITFLTDDSLEDKYNGLTTYVNEYIDLEEMVHRIILSELSVQLGLEYSEQLGKTDTFGRNLIDWVVRNLFYLDSDNNLYHRYTSDFNVDKEKIPADDGKYKQIRIDGATVMRLAITKKENNYLEKLRGMMANIGKTDLMKYYSSMNSEKEKANNAINDIIRGLDREIEIPIYPGTCNYLSPSEKR